MSRKVDVTITLPDKIFKDVITPAKRDNILDFLVSKCVEVYNLSPEMRDLVDSMVYKDAERDLNELIERLHDNMGDVGASMAVMKDTLSTPVEDTGGVDFGGGSRPDQLENRVNELESMIRDMANRVQALQDGVESGQLTRVSTPKPELESKKPVETISLDTGETSEDSEADTEVGADEAMDFLGGLFADED